MANTYTKIYFHLVFAVKNRQAFIPAELQARVHKYMAGVLANMGHYVVAVGGIDDHVHVLIDYNPAQSLPDMVRELKVATTKFINENHMIPFKFAWQRGYSCFSYAPSQVDSVKNYVLHQPEHHKNMSLKDEIRSIYERFGVEYKDEYIFE